MGTSLALVGCGAIAQKFYLPSLAAHRRRLGSLWMVDPCDELRSLAASILGGRACARMAEIDEPIDLAIVAAPNSLHFLLADEALRAGAHVLVEKPFALNPAEAQALINLARRTDRVLAVNQTRRFFRFAEELRWRIRGGEFGCLCSIVHREGVRLAWPFASGAAFAPGAQRTGVIMDFGVHVLDFYQFLLEPDWSFLAAIHDGFQGPEGLAEIELLASGAPVSLRLSRYCEQENVAHLAFQRADVSFHVHDAERYCVHWRDGRREHCACVAPPADRSTLADRVLGDFMAAAEGRHPPLCSALSALPVTRILDEIYHKAPTYEATPGYV